MSAGSRDERPRSSEEPGATDQTGAGSEATEGIHGQSQGGRDQRDASAVSGARTGLSDAGSDVASKGGVSAGSEPMAGRGAVHESGYGGAGGRPKTSADQREPENVANTDRDARAAAGQSSSASGPLGDEEAGDGLGNPTASPDSSGARNIGAERKQGGKWGQADGGGESEAQEH